MLTIKKAWSDCAERLDHVVRSDYKSEKLTRQLAAVLKRAAKVPELSATLEAAERDGFIAGTDVLPSRTVFTSLRPLKISDPSYPRAALHLGIEGYAEVLFHVDMSGTVESVEVLDAYPPNVFEQAAAAAALQWKFEPATKNGAAVPSAGVERIEFRLSRD